VLLIVRSFTKMSFFCFSDGTSMNEASSERYPVLYKTLNNCRRQRNFVWQVILLFG